MGFETISEPAIEYGLISFDAAGQERPEQSGLMSEILIDKATNEPVTNVFFFCHGWRGDLPAARGQYNKWITAFMTSDDVPRASRTFPGFRPLFVGLHWPSEPWGDEELGGGAFGPGGALAPEALLNAYLDRLGDRPAIRQALEVIIAEARHNVAPDELPPHVVQAYLDLNEALGLKSEGVGAAPEADREGFDPEASFEAMNEEGAAFGGGLSVGGLLGPLRQLSYWTMKARARTVGEGGMHRFLVELQRSTADKQTRIHLMGHSFGTIVVSGMLGGPGARAALPRPVDSVVLVQGAVSLWTYAAEIPFPEAGAGYFSPLFADNKIRGPLVTTRSKFDRAVGVFYPLASRLRGSASFGEYPEYGGIGAYGIQGLPDAIRAEMSMLETGQTYSFEPGKVYNLDGSRFISHMEGASGAHSDIAGPEVAHAIWEAALAAV